MFPCQNKISGFFLSPVVFRKALLFLFTPVFLLPWFGCAFADLRPVTLTTVPDCPFALLPEAESPAIVRFDTEMEKSSAEKAVQIYSPAGIVEGEFRWEKNALFFFPVFPWQPGIRYALRLSGTVFAKDGRELPLSGDIPFYAVSCAAQPYVKSFSPPDGASRGTPGPLMLEINFSLPMNRLTTEDALTFDIPGKKTYHWLDDDKTLRVNSDKQLNPWTVYRWSISEKAKSAEGAPLAKEFSASFSTDLDRGIIKVKQLLPLIPPVVSEAASSADISLWGSWNPAGTSLEQGPGPGQGIGVEFSRPPESGSLRGAFSFEPSLPGRVEILSPVSAVFIPSKDPEPETVYRLRISGSLRDEQGIAMGEDYTASFTPEISYLKILSVSFGTNGEKHILEPDGVFPVPVHPGGIVRCYFCFSSSFEAEKTGAREEAAFKITLKPFFPESLTRVSLRSAAWLSSDRLLLEWEGISAGNSGAPHYYKLHIPGGQGGVRNGGGSFIKEDFSLYLEAVND